MSAPSVTQRDKNTLGKRLHKWFGANRGTHWSIAGSIAVIIFGVYLIYNNHDSNPVTAPTNAATAQAPIPMAPDRPH
jgi:hypothetical protein